MQTFDADLNLFTKPNAGDDTLFVTFRMDITQDHEKTQAEGRPIFRDEEYVRIVVPGDKTNIVDRPVRESDKVRFPKQYAAFKAGAKEEEQLEGTRLKEWPYITRSQAEELSYLGIKTVEQLSAVRDDVMTRVPGLANLKRNASAWLAQTKDSALAAKQAAELDELRNQNELLQEALRDLQSQVAALRKGGSTKAAAAA